MPGAGGMGGGGYGSDQYTNAMRMMAMGDILKGGDGNAYYGYMQQLEQARQADAKFAAQQGTIAEQRAYERAQAEAELARQQAEQQAATQGMTDYFAANTPNPVRQFQDSSDAVAADAMAYVKPEMFPGLSQDTINLAARRNDPNNPNANAASASALISMFYNMPDDVAQGTQAGYQDGEALFSYDDQDSREWARENAPQFGYGFEGAGPEAKFEAQQSMPTPMAPERMAQIMQNPVVPEYMKKDILARFGPQDTPEAGFDIPDGYMLQDPNDPRSGVVPIPGLEGGGAGATEYGLTPQIVVDHATGELQLLQLAKDGTSKVVDIPEGHAVSRGLEKIDLGTSWQWYNHMTGEPIGEPIPKDIRGAASEQAIGTATGQAEVDKAVEAPAAVAEAENALGLIDTILSPDNADALDGVLGKYEGAIQPGTFAGALALSQDETDIIPMIEQVQGKVFLQAFENLKGGGQITEVEGKKAEAAMARLARTQSPKAFRAALQELRSIVGAGLERARSGTVVSQPQGGTPNLNPIASVPGGFASNPTMQAAAKANGITVEEYWDILPEEGKRQWLK